MLGNRRQRMHTTAAESRLEPFHQRRQRFAVGAPAVFVKQARGMPGKRFRRLGPQTDQLDSRRQFEPLQVLSEYASNPSRVARRAGKTERKNGGRSLPRTTFVCKLEKALTDPPPPGGKPAAQ